MKNKFRLEKLKAPLFVHVDLTRHCNLGCFYCAIRDNSSVEPEYFPNSHFEKIIDALGEAEVFDVTFFGGEPFLYKGIYELGEYAKGKGLSVGFVTNGSLIQKEDMPRIKKSFDSGGVALNGVGEVHDRLCGKNGAFEKSRATIEMLINNAFPVGINSVVCRSNINHLDDFLKWLSTDLPANSIHLNFYSSYYNKQPEEVLTIEEMQKAFKIIELHRQGDLKGKVSINQSIPICFFDQKYSSYYGSCSAGWTFAGIDIYGNIKICPSSSTVLGNIFENSLTEIWQNSDEIKYFRSNLWVDPRCKNCLLLEQCHGGCMVTSSTTKYSLPRYYETSIKPIVKSG